MTQPRKGRAQGSTRPLKAQRRDVPGKAALRPPLPEAVFIVELLSKRQSILKFDVTLWPGATHANLAREIAIGIFLNPFAPKNCNAVEIVISIEKRLLYRFSAQRTPKDTLTGFLYDIAGEVYDTLEFQTKANPEKKWTRIQDGAKISLIQDRSYEPKEPTEEERIVAGEAIPF